MNARDPLLDADDSNPALLVVGIMAALLGATIGLVGGVFALADALLGDPGRAAPHLKLAAELAAPPLIIGAALALIARGAKAKGL